MKNEETLLRDTLVKRYNYKFITVYKLYSVKGKYAVKITPSYTHNASTDYASSIKQFQLDLKALGIKYINADPYKEYYLQIAKNKIKNFCGMLILLPKEQIQ